MKIFEDEKLVFIQMTKEDYHKLCEFMTKNGVGYGEGRSLVDDFRIARDKLERQKRG